ncbi:hypothetical protein GCM10025869_00800 [Homoserinibacter gongjuensis]|uniref:Tetratrico peptide repeat group 5 domain-containing protein n=1 Tax=Homoserinibacter gongjuensis TaxID=1162968 RepID=A0ABQ6JPQ5_9MICO|nr:hypothetical protein GCM10025869_00800 [Homoserinibacter gongjuensis]
MQWRERMAAVWADADRLEGAELVRRIDAIAAEHPDDPLALFERGGARDSTGDEAGAEEFYRRALAAGLPDDERAQCVIQLASTVRNLGRPEESLELLRAEFEGRPDSPTGMRLSPSRPSRSSTSSARSRRWRRSCTRSPRTCRATTARCPPTPTRCSSAEPRAAGTPPRRQCRKCRRARACRPWVPRIRAQPVA